jgi:5S rRNA maturation endonuclease (ribonuclease M5)
MSAIIQPLETPRDAAKRLAANAMRDGYKPVALHEYRGADGTPVFWRLRCKHPNGDKWIRPMYRNGTAYVFGEPPVPATGKLLYRLPELLAADAAATVWVVEGESCTDALAKAGAVVTTSGSADSADAADWSPLQGRSVIVWPDNDEAGCKYADKVGARLRAIGCAVSVVDVAALNLPDKGDCVDWLKVNPNATAADIEALALLPVKIAQPALRDMPEQSAPEPLRRPTPPAEPYPLAELGEVLRPAAESIRRVIQAPDAIIGGALLAAASLATQAQADVHIDGRVIPLSLWLLSVAESGERKSAVDGEAMRAAREYERELSKAYAEDCEQHTADMAEHEARRDAVRSEAKKAKGEGLADKLRAVGAEPQAPLLPRVTAADFTAEGLFKLLCAGRPSIGAFTDEAALVFGGHGMTKETVMRTAGTLCKLWDRGELDRVRSGDGAAKLYGRRFALHLLAQPVIAERALSDDVLAGQGFLARCLLAWPEGTAGNRQYQAEALRDDAAMQRLSAVLLNLHRLALPLADGERQELQPRALRLSDDAFNYWRTVHDTVERQCGPLGRFAQVKPWASKTAEQALRIAGVLTLVEQPGAQVIEATTMERAAELALWHLNEALRLAGTAELSPEVRDAEALLSWAHVTGRRYLHSGAALQFGPRPIREREVFIVAVGELVRAGWAVPVDGGMVLEGKHRRNVWRIVPASDGV